MTATADTPGPASDATTVRRNDRRAVYGHDAVMSIARAGLLAHVGLIAADGRPVVIPMIYGVIDDDLALHGSPASRLLRAGATEVDLCATITIVDGLVVARSTFHHSLNYRSAVIMGRARKVTDPDEKSACLDVITEHVMPGRVGEVRPSTDKEIKGTLVLRLPMAEASAKVRDGGPIDEESDLDPEVWAGVLPLGLAITGDPIPDTVAVPTVGAPPSVTGWAPPDAER